MATLLWNQSEHLELYCAVPLMGAVLHMLNSHLHPHDLSYIAAHAGDRVIVVDETLLHLLDSVDWEFGHVIVVSHSGSVPAAATEYEALIASAPPMSWPPLGERRAAAMFYTSGHHGPAQGGRLLASRARPAPWSPRRPMCTASAPATSSCRRSPCSTSTPGACRTPRH